MRLFSVIGVILALFNKLDGKADWDTFQKYHHLIQSQAVIDLKPCLLNTDVTHDFGTALYNVNLKAFRKISVASDAHFVFSPYSIWMILSAIAEGTTGPARQELVDFLMLPQDECLRDQYYKLATTLEPPGEDVQLSRSSILILDNNVNLNGHWEHFARTKSLLRTSSAPIKSDPVGAADLIRKNLQLQLPTPNFDGNSVIVDTLNYEGLWTYAFSDAIIERAPFYDDAGKKVGYVDLMKIKKRVKVVYVPSINTKLLELPVGFRGRYRMLFGINLGKTEVKKSISDAVDRVLYDILDGLKESIIPLEVAIPRFRMTTEIDMRKILEEIGVQTIWNDVSSTRNISEPAALPTSFIQRTTMTMDTTGIRSPISEVSNIVPATGKEELETGLDPILGKDFIIDRPFLFGLFEAKTYDALLVGAFSTPSYGLKD